MVGLLRLQSNFCYNCDVKHLGGSLVLFLPLCRHQIPRPDGTAHTFEDFNIGQQVHFLFCECTQSQNVCFFLKQFRFPVLNGFGKQCVQPGWNPPPQPLFSSPPVFLILRTMRSCGGCVKFQDEFEVDQKTSGH